MAKIKIKIGEEESNGEEAGEYTDKVAKLEEVKAMIMSGDVEGAVAKLDECIAELGGSAPEAPVEEAAAEGNPESFRDQVSQYM